MEILGWVFIAILGLILFTGVVLGLVNLPDARRYLKMRHM